jgi:HEPN domain-containing protein
MYYAILKIKIFMEVQVLESKQNGADSFRSFIQQLVEKFQPTRIISFGEQTVQNKLKGCFVKKKVKNRHYCLLVCMESCTRIEHTIQDFANSHFHCGEVTVVCHGESTIREEIHSNNGFFITVLSKGKHLYTGDGFLNIETIPKFNPSKSLEKAEKHYSHRISLVQGFWECARESLSRGNYAITTFLLHQAVEQSSIMLIRVHLSYRSEFHNLRRLLGLCKCFSDEPYNLLLGDNPANRRLFEILIKSYGQARYSSEFVVSQKDAQELFDMVSTFIELVKAMCRGKLVMLAEELDE